MFSNNKANEGATLYSISTNSSINIEENIFKN